MVLRALEPWVGFWLYLCLVYAHKHICVPSESQCLCLYKMRICLPCGLHRFMESVETLSDPEDQTWM